MKLAFLILTIFTLSFLTTLSKVYADNSLEAAEAMAGIEKITTDSIIIESYTRLPFDSIPKKTYSEPEFRTEIPAFIFFIGILSLITGVFSPLVTLILGGVFIAIGIITLILYSKLKKSNPFKSINIIGKIIGWIFFILLMALMIAAIIMTFVMALALIIAAIAGTFVNPAYIALSIMGLGALIFLTNLVVYLFRLRRYRKQKR